MASEYERGFLAGMRFVKESMRLPLAGTPGCTACMMGSHHLGDPCIVDGRPVPGTGIYAGVAGHAHTVRSYDPGAPERP